MIDAFGNLDDVTKVHLRQTIWSHNQSFIYSIWQNKNYSKINKYCLQHISN